MNEKIPPELESELKEAVTFLIPLEELYNIAKGLGFPLTWRTLNYYKTLGLLSKPTKRKGDKKGYYDVAVIHQLSEIFFLKTFCQMSLKEISKLKLIERPALGLFIDLFFVKVAQNKYKSIFHTSGFLLLGHELRERLKKITFKAESQIMKRGVTKEDSKNITDEMFKEFDKEYDSIAEAAILRHEKFRSQIRERGKNISIKEWLRLTFKHFEK